MKPLAKIPDHTTVERCCRFPRNVTLSFVFWLQLMLYNFRHLGYHLNDTVRQPHLRKREATVSNGSPQAESFSGDILLNSLNQGFLTQVSKHGGINKLPYAKKARIGWIS